MSIEALLENGCIPYIATSEHLLPCFNTKPFGYTLTPYCDGPDKTNFHQAYIRSNTLAFEADLTMPQWVYIDYVMLQTASIGFMIERKRVPNNVLAQFDADPLVEVGELDFVPISGQTAGLTADKETWQGVSLFSLAKHFPDLRSLGLGTYTRALALEAFGAKKFRGITQYDNSAVSIHGKTAKEFFIKQAIVWLHPRTHMTFIYEQEPSFTLDDLRPREAEEYSFLISAYDFEAKKRIEAGLREGKRYKIVPPFQIKKGDDLLLPIVEC